MSDLTETPDESAGDHFDALHYLWCDMRFDVTNPCTCGAPVKFREAAEQLAAKDAELTILRGDVEFRDRQIASLMDAAS